jgi:uncharacterized protein (DUF2252 family)
MKSLEERLIEFHRDRNQPTLALKYELMSKNEFAFFRGTCHLFYEDLHKDASLAAGPLVWACGDLHVENFGSYRAFNGLTYFDINDFDEAMLAPACWDLVRFLCSIGMASDLWKYSAKEAEQLMLLAMKEYSRQLAAGKAYAIEKETSPPLIQEFFEMAERKKEKEMIKSRINKKKEQLKIIQGKTLPIAKQTYREVKAEVNDHLKEHYPFLKIRDIAFRIAGMGSLGIKRYAVLVEDVREDKWRLLDVKQACLSSLAPYLTIAQPKWKCESERVTTVQRLMQYAPPRFFGTLTIGSEDFVLKQLQPSAQKIDHSLCHGKMKNVETIMATMAQAVASGQLRSAARKGSTDVDGLIKFSLNSFWQNDLVQTALSYTSEMKKYFKLYSDLYKTRKLKA